MLRLKAADAATYEELQALRVKAIELDLPSLGQHIPDPSGAGRAEGNINQKGLRVEVEVVSGEITGYSPEV